VIAVQKKESQGWLSWETRHHDPVHEAKMNQEKKTQKSTKKSDPNKGT